MKRKKLSYYTVVLEHELKRQVTSKSDSVFTSLYTYRQMVHKSQSIHHTHLQNDPIASSKG